MELKIIEYETADLAYEAGFPQCTNECYVGDWFCPDYNHVFPEGHTTENIVSAPTQELLRQHLRDEHEIHISIGIELMPEMKAKLRGYTCGIQVMERATLIKSNEVSGAPINASYEQALEAGLKEALKYLLNQKTEL